jgi:hypothetical protein
MTRDSAPPAARPVDARPTATVNLEPIGERAGSARGYSVRLHLPLSNFDEKFADRVSVLAVAQRALGDLGDGEAPHYFDVVSAKGKLLAIDASMVHGESLDAQAIGRMRETLSGAGYHVAIRTVRECTNDACGATMPMDASHADRLVQRRRLRQARVQVVRRLQQRVPHVEHERRRSGAVGALRGVRRHSRRMGRHKAVDRRPGDARRSLRLLSRSW